MDVTEVAALVEALDGVRRTERDGLLHWSVGGRLVARQEDADASSSADPRAAVARNVIRIARNSSQIV